MNPQLSLVLLVAASLLVSSSLAQTLRCESRTGLGRVEKEVEDVSEFVKREAKPSCWNEATTRKIDIFPVRGTTQSEQVLYQCIDREGSQLNTPLVAVIP